MYQFKLSRFDGYEEVCGMEKETAHPDLKRSREGESTEESPEKRHRLLFHWNKPSKCCIY